MTARPAQRRRRTVVGAAAALVLVLLAGGLAAVGASTVVNSKAGEVIEGETRTVVAFPGTDNAALAVVDDDNRLTSLTIATLDPDGLGGSIVTIPVNADASIGLGDTRRPLNRELDVADPDRFFEAVSGTLAITLQYGEIVSVDRLEALIAPVVPAAVFLPADVFDTATSESTPIVAAGDRQMSAISVVKALRAHDVAGLSYDHHWLDVAIWSGLAANAPVDEPVRPPADEFGRPVPAASIDELFARLWSGGVQVRDLAVQQDQSVVAADAVVIDRLDSMLVFAQASPGRMSTPNPGLVFRVVVPFSDEQIAATDGQFSSRSDVARTAIGELLFLAANVISVDTSPAPDGAVATGRIDVADDRFIADLQTLVPLVFGTSDVVEATELVDGVDIVLTLGTSYLDLKREQRGAVDPGAETAGAGTSGADDASSGDTVGADG